MLKPIGEILKEKNIELGTDNPVVRGGFTQVPNFILKDSELSLGSRLTYAMFLSYAWHNDSCFPGQERLAVDMGMSRSRVTTFIGELEKAGLVEIQRRGLGKTNIYTIQFRVEAKVTPKTNVQMSAGRHLDVRPSTPGSQPANFSHYKNMKLKNIQNKNTQ
jgi:hypothetical protein